MEQVLRSRFFAGVVLRRFPRQLFRGPPRWAPAATPDGSRRLLSDASVGSLSPEGPSDKSGGSSAKGRKRGRTLAIASVAGLGAAVAVGGAAAKGLLGANDGPMLGFEDVRIVDALPAGLVLPREGEEGAPRGPTAKAACWEVALFQYESCPFCRKVRSVLDFYSVPYEVFEVNPLSKRETKSFAKDYQKVPILTLLNPETQKRVQLRDSKRIVDEVMRVMAEQLVPPGQSLPAASSSSSPFVPRLPSVTPRTTGMWPPLEETREEEAKKDGSSLAPVPPPGALGAEKVGSVEAKWVLWTDRVLVQLVVANIYRSLGEARETFDYLLTHAEMRRNVLEMTLAYWSGVLVMRLIASARKRKYKLAEEREALYEALEEFAGAVGEQPFLGGDRPGRADFNVYGVMRSCEGFTTERDLKRNALNFTAWYARMSEAVGPSRAKFVSGQKPAERGPSTQAV